MADWEDAPGQWEDAPAPKRLEASKPKPKERGVEPMLGVFDAGLSLASAAVAGPLSGIAGLAGAAIPGRSGQGADWVNKVQNALTYEPRSARGRGITDAVSYPFVKLAELGDWAGGKTAEGSDSPAAGAGVNMALQGVPLLLGRVKPAKPKGPSPARLEADAKVLKAQEAGYSVPPTQANPNALNQVMEGAGGKIKTAQALSEKNQPRSDGLVREHFSLPDDAPLAPETFAAIRKEAGASYERVRNSGRVDADPVYTQALDSIAEPFARAAKDFPESARTDILNAVNAAKRESFDASSAVDQIRIFREKADTAYGGRDKALGKAYKGIAEALEEQLGRHLEKIGAPDTVLSEFRNARRTIAQAYTVEKHVKSGHIDARGLANELKKRPLDGNLRIVAEFGQNFPKAAQIPEKVGGIPTSPLDMTVSLASIGTALATGNPAIAAGAALPYIRPQLRNLMASRGYQQRFVRPQDYGPTTFDRMRNVTGDLHRQPLIPLSEISEGQRSY